MWFIVAWLSEFSGTSRRFMANKTWWQQNQPSVEDDVILCRCVWVLAFMKIICSFAELQRSFSITPSSPRPQYQTGLLNCQICTTPLDLQTGQDGFITGEPQAQIHHTHHDYLNSSLVILLLDFAIASMDVLEKNNIPTPLYHIDQNKKKMPP